MNNKILVSVIIPVYNGENYIEEAIKSVIDQEYHSKEIIVVNDGSIDKTEEIVSNLNLDNLKLINTKNYGQASAINTGIYSASGNIVGYLSADDIFKPKLLTHIVNEFLKNPKVACVYPNYNLINQKGIHIKSIIIPKFSEQVMFENLYCYPGPGAFFYKSHFLKLNGFDSRFRQIPDFEFWIRLSKYGEFVKINKELASFRVHESSGSVKKISVRRSNEILILSNNMINEGWDSNKIKSKAYLISAFHHLKSKRIFTGLIYVFRSIILRPDKLISFDFYKLFLKGILH